MKNKNLLISMYFLFIQILIVFITIIEKDYPSLLWFCHHSSLLLAISFFYNKVNFTKSIINLGLFFQFLWAIDFFSKFIFGSYILGSTEYVFNMNTMSKFVTIISHLLTISIAILFTYNKKQDNKKILGYSLIYGLILFILTTSFTNPAENINCFLKICGFENLTPIGYKYYSTIFLFLFIIYPANKFQEFLYKISKKLNP